MSFYVGFKIRPRFPAGEVVQHMFVYEKLGTDRFRVDLVAGDGIIMRVEDPDDVRYIVNDECTPLYGHGDGPYPPRVTLVGVRNDRDEDVTFAFKPPPITRRQIREMIEARREAVELDESGEYRGPGCDGGCGC